MQRGGFVVKNGHALRTILLGIPSPLARQLGSRSENFDELAGSNVHYLHAGTVELFAFQDVFHCRVG